MDAACLRAFGPGPGPSYDPLAAVPCTAARVEGGRIRHFRAHLERLMASAAAAGQPAPWLMAEADAIGEWVADVIPRPLGVLRLRIQGAQAWALAEPLADMPLSYLLKLLPHPLQAPDVHPLAPHKGLLGVWNAAPLNEAKAAGAHDALFHWPDGTLVETAIASIALEREGDILLPPREGRVASLSERLDLPEWAGPRKIRIEPFSASELGQGRLWCFNAVRGIWPGTRL